MVISRENNSAYWALRITFGLVPLIAGLDKFVNYLTDWTQYLNRSILNVIHLTPVNFMHVVGAVEIFVGLAVLFGATRVFGYITMLWLWAIAINLISTGQFFDIALRDIGLSLGAFSLAELSQARASVVVTRDIDDYRDYRRVA